MELSLIFTESADLKKNVYYFGFDFSQHYNEGANNSNTADRVDFTKTLCLM